MGSERRPTQCKYWNLRPVVMPECSLIATRNSHAKHNKSVVRIPEHRQAKDYYAKDYKRSCFGSEIKGRNSRNLTSCTNTNDRLKVRNTSRICQKTIKPLSTRWARANKPFEFLSKHKWNQKRQSVCWRGTYALFRWKQCMYSKSYANKHKLVTFLIPEYRQKKSYKSTSYNG